MPITRHENAHYVADNTMLDLVSIQLRCRYSKKFMCGKDFGGRDNPDEIFVKGICILIFMGAVDITMAINSVSVNKSLWLIKTYLQILAILLTSRVSKNLRDTRTSSPL